MRNTIVSCIITAILSLGVSYLMYLKNIEISKLDLFTKFDNEYISKPKFPNSKIEFKVGGEDKDRLGLYTLSLVNFSSKAFQKLPLSIKITPEKLDNFKVVAYSTVGENGNYQLVKESSKLKDGKARLDDDGRSYIFDFTVEYINRVEEPAEGFTLNILYEGKLVEKPIAIVSGENISTREYDASNRPDEPILKLQVYSLAILALILFIGAMILVTWFVISPIMSLLTINSESKRNKKYSKQLFDAFKEENQQSNLSDDVIKNYIVSMLYQRQVTWFNSKSKFTKWSLANIKPKRSDYDFE